MYLIHFLILWVPVLWIVHAMVDDQPYCSGRHKRLCLGKGRHVACQFFDPGPGPSCENYTAIRFSSELKHFILHYVNRRRQRIASGNERVRGGLHLPKPELMMMVEWDRELAFLAQRLADQCHFVHDDCRATVRYPYAGQTVGEVRWRRSEEPIELGAKRSIRRVFDAWWGERRRVQPQQITAPFRLTAKGAVWGHFSQLAVWTLQAMGCGAVHHGSNHPRLLLVCDFSHTNMLGQRTLSPGPMAPCPIHFIRRPRSQYPLLCGPVRHPVIIQAEEEDYEEQEEDEEEDPGMTIDSIDVPTPSIRYVKFTKTRARTTKPTVAFPVPKFREDLNFRPKGLFIEKLGRELESKTWKVDTEREQESKNKAVYKSRYMEDYVMPIVREWKTRERPYPTAWNENQDLIEVQPLPKQTTLVILQDPNVLEYFGSKHVTEAAVTRQRWKQTRDRPKRPGENALLYTQTTNHQKRLSAIFFRNQTSFILREDRVCLPSTYYPLSLVDHVQRRELVNTYVKRQLSRGFHHDVFLHCSTNDGQG